MRNLLAFDLGASNGRAILGQFDGETITMRELHRFENNYIEMNGVFYWDLPYLYNQLKQGLLAFKNANVGTLDCIGIDTWGVDYGLLDKNGQLLSNPRSYRYAVDEDMAEVWKTVDFPTLFARTGIATMNFNTVYQLYRRKLQEDPALDAAETMLLMPDLLGFFLTGEAKTEYTNATTSMLYNPTTKDWDWQTIEALELPKKIFTPLDRAGSLRGTLRPELAEELGLTREEVVEALNVSAPPLSLTVSSEEGETQIDLPVQSPEENLSERMALRQILGELEPRDRQLIILRYFMDKTQTQTAEQLGMTQVQVSRREKKILLWLRERLI